MGYKQLFASPKTVRDLKNSLELYQRLTSPIVDGEIVIDGMGQDIEITEIGIYDGKLVIEIRVKQ